MSRLNCPTCNAPGEPLLTHICHCRSEAVANPERNPVTEKLPKKWCASRYTNSITLKKMTAENVRFPRGTYHETWEEAHAALLERLKIEVKVAERDFQSARRALDRAKVMPPPVAKGGAA